MTMGEKRSNKKETTQFQHCAECRLTFPKQLGSKHEQVCDELKDFINRDDLDELSKRGLFRKQCPFCTEDCCYFHSKTEFRNHLAKDHQISMLNEAKYKPASTETRKSVLSCDKCKLEFSDPNLVHLHQATCTYWQFLWSSREQAEFEFCCVFCSTTDTASSFSSFDDLKVHLRKSHNVTVADTASNTQHVASKKTRKRKRPMKTSDSPYSCYMLSSLQRKVEFPYKTPCLYRNCTFTHSIQPHLNFEHYKETHNKKFSCRHYCPLEKCNCSYSRKNVLAAHLRKAHEIQEDQIANFTNNDDDPVTIDCLLCGADMTKMTSAEETEHFEKVHQLDQMPHYQPVSFTSELMEEDVPRSRLNSIGSNPFSEPGDHSRPRPVGVSDYHPLSESAKRFRQFGHEFDNHLYGYHYY